MLPKELGGVVNPNLQVHGTGELSFGSNPMKVEVGLTCVLANVQIADSSIYPFEFAAHVRWLTFLYASPPAHCHPTAQVCGIRSSRTGCSDYPV